MIWKYVEPTSSGRGSLAKSLFFKPRAIADLRNAFTLWVIEGTLVIADPRSIGISIARPFEDALQFWHSLESLVRGLSTLALRRTILSSECGQYVLKIPRDDRQWSMFVYDWELGVFRDPMVSNDSGIFIGPDVLLGFSEDFKSFRIRSLDGKRNETVQASWIREISGVREIRHTMWFAAQPQESSLPYGFVVVSVSYRMETGEPKKCLYKVDFFKDGERIRWTEISENCEAVTRAREDLALVGTIAPDSVMLERNDGNVGIIRFEHLDSAPVVGLSEPVKDRELTYVDSASKYWHVWRDQRRVIHCDCQIELAAGL